MSAYVEFKKAENYYSLDTMDNKWILTNEIGEGMEVSEELLFDAMDKIFKEHF